jgi:hypothetical protein
MNLSQAYLGGVGPGTVTIESVGKGAHEEKQMFQ